MKKKVNKSAVGRDIEMKELKHLWKNMDISKFWSDVMAGAIPKIEAYDHARAKSLAHAHEIVFI